MVNQGLACRNWIVDRWRARWMDVLGIWEWSSLGSFRTLHLQSFILLYLGSNRVLYGTRTYTRKGSGGYKRLAHVIMKAEKSMSGIFLKTGRPRKSEYNSCPKKRILNQGSWWWLEFKSCTGRMLMSEEREAGCSHACSGNKPIFLFTHFRLLMDRMICQAHHWARSSLIYRFEC